MGDIVSMISGGVGGVANLLRQPDAPKAAPPTSAAPLQMDSEAILAAKKKSIIDQQQRSGRQSTILSGTNNDRSRDTLGG